MPKSGRHRKDENVRRADSKRIKRCTKCLKNKAPNLFQNDVRYKDGKHSWCKACKLDSQRRHPEANRNWVLKNKDRVTEIKKRYVDKHLDRVRNAKERWYKRNPEKRLANCRNYQASKINAMPKWLSTEQKMKIVEFYKNRPAGYSIDHIVPLRGRNVCGLHVPWNLQYLKHSENRKKSNLL